MIDKEEIFKLIDLLESVTSDGISKAIDYKKSHKFLSKHYKFPKLSNSFENGMPSISETFFDEGPIDFTSFFTNVNKDNDKILICELKGYSELQTFLRNNGKISETMGLKDFEDISQIREIRLNSLITSIIDRYLNINSSDDYIENRLIEILFERMSRFFSENLKVKIAIPILMTTFDDFENEKFIINDEISIEKLSSEYQLARSKVDYYGSGVHKTVLACATHMIIFEVYNIENKTYSSFYNTVYKSTAYPLNRIDNLFAVIRLATGYVIGYAQLLCIPQDWADVYTANLPPIYGTSIRAYPQFFDDYIWLKNVNHITIEQLNNISEIYIKLINIEENKLHIAINRFNKCFLRDNKEDSILDAIIALEILLSDDDKGELTYKISNRMAAIISISKTNEFTPKNVSNSMPKIYNYRSNIVHGRISKKPNDMIAIEEKTIPIVELAISYLRIAIKTLIINPEYLDIKKIDSYIINSFSEK